MLIECKSYYRIGGVELEVKSLKEENKRRDTIDDLNNEGLKCQKEILEKLETRIDVNEENLALLMENDKKQDEMLEDLESTVIPNIKSKLEELENADEFLRVMRLFFQTFLKYAFRTKSLKVH